MNNEGYPNVGAGLREETFLIRLLKEQPLGTACG